MVVATEKILLSVASHLSRRTSLHEVSRDSSPISLPYLLQSQQEQPVLFLRPRNTSLALATTAGGVNDVVGGVAGVGAVGVLSSLVVLRNIVHTGALPEGACGLRDSHAKEHDRVLSGGGAAISAAANLRARPGVVAVVPALRARARHGLLQRPRRYVITRSVPYLPVWLTGKSNRACRERRGFFF